MADPKPPAAAPEPITLRDLIELFASTVVSTSQQLDQASVDLRNLYLNSGNAALATLMPPRYILDQVTIDLIFVVTAAKPEVSGTKLPDAHKLVLKDPVPVEDSEFLHSKLADVARSEALPAAKARSSQIEAQLNLLKNNLASAQANLFKYMFPPVLRKQIVYANLYRCPVINTARRCGSFNVQQIPARRCDRCWHGLQR